MRRLQAVALLCGLAATGGGCRYTVGSSLPPGLRSVFVPVFDNATRVVGLEGEVTAAVISEFQSEGALRPAAEKSADCTLRGKLVSYKRDKIRSGASGLAGVRDVTIRVELSLEQRSDGKALFEGLQVSSRRTDSTAGYFRIERGESERLGRERAVRALAKAIVRATVEYW